MICSDVALPGGDFCHAENNGFFEKIKSFTLHFSVFFLNFVA